MIFEFQQVRKELYSADFSLLEDTGANIGDAHLSGDIKRIDGDWSMHVLGHTIEMNRINAKEAAGLIASCTKDQAFHPFSVMIDGQVCGVIFQGIHKLSLFREYNIHQIIWNRKDRYCMYPIGLGEDGSKNPVYADRNGAELQMGQIEKDSVTRDDLHIFHAYTPNREDVITLSLFCALMYTMGCYKPGVKVIKGEKKTVSITKNPEVLSKYNPNFWVH